MSKRIRIHLSGMDHRLLDKSADSITKAAKSTGVDVRGPVPFPMKVKKFTVLKSPHKHKSSREQFEYRCYHRLIDIINPVPSTVNSLTKLEILAGVDVRINIDK